MRIIFRLVGEGHSLLLHNAELYKTTGKWKKEHGERFTISQHDRLRILEFSNKEDFELFKSTYKPKRDHWWQNAIIEE